MARLPRLYTPDLPSHIIVRGNNRQDIFRSDGDRLHFLACLLEASRKNALPIHSYVLMTNHVHLLATGKHRDSAARTIQSIGRRYVAYFNGRYKRTGTLWEGRFRSTVVEADRYLLACHRYIDLNPVRAGMTAHPADYAWSSHRFYVHGRPDDLIVPHALVRDLGNGPARTRAAYTALFDQPLEDKMLARIRFCSNKGWALGSEEFCATLGARMRRRPSPTAGGWPKGRKRSPAGAT